jgi:tetratricopeptide (TPR) repeat protein
LTLYEWGLTLTFLRRYAAAEDQFERAIAVAPDRPDAYHYAAWNYLLRDGTTERARRQLIEVPTFDDPRLVYLTLLFDYYDRDFGAMLAGIAEIQDGAIDLIDEYLPNDLLRCVALDAAGDRDRARTACESVVSFLVGELDSRPYDHRLHSALGRAYAVLGRDDDAVAAAKRAVELNPVSRDSLEGPSPAIDFAKISARVGDHEQAIDRLEELLSIPSRVSAPLLRLDPAWDPLRDHPRFQELLEGSR